MAKRLELLKDAMPNLTRAAVLVKPDNPLFKSTIPAVQAAANSLKIELQQFDARGVNEFEPAFLAMTKNRVEAVVLQEDAVFLGNLRQFVELADGQALPIAGPVECSESGWSDWIRSRFSSHVSARCGLRGQDPPWRQAHRPAGRASHQV